MKIRSFFPLTSGAYIGLLCAIAGIAFLIYFFAASPVETYRHIRTDRGEVIEIDASIMRETYSNIYPSDATARVEFRDGSVGDVPFLTQQHIYIGAIIDVDILEANGEKPRYRLAAEPIAP